MLDQPYYIEKVATQQELFLSTYPSFDGRGIKIAIIDSLVDVSLDGLHKTSEGLPKIIDCFDFTGAGDVDTSKVKELDSENCLIGLSGRKLKIPSTWSNPSGKWHLGILSLFKPLYYIPGFHGLLKRLSEEKLPEMDCIVWNDGKKWLACIETFGDLEDAKVLTNFRDEHGYGILKNKLEMCYCISVQNNGKLLEIFTAYDYHATGIAQIAAAHFPNEPEKDGLAPGAQIISMNVSDRSNENVMNDGAVKKAFSKCIEMKVDIVIYTIDEELENLMIEMVKKHHVLFFNSAGNYGPFYQGVHRLDLSFYENTFTIGAILTSEMMKNIPGKFTTTDSKGEENPSPMVFNFSSRGPDGNGLGVDFVAPGAATVNFPKYFISTNQVVEGTSFSTPNAAGSVACLLSALKQKNIQYSFSMIKFILFKTAKLPQKGNKLEFGHGIVQIDAAFDYCKNGIDTLSMVLWTNIEKANIYFVRKDADTKEFEIKLPNLPSTSADKMGPNWILKLSSEAQKYINVSQINSDNSFSVKIDTTKLEEGSLNFAEIEVLHPSNPVFNHIFDIPITVIVPLKADETSNIYFEKEIYLNYENPLRFFIDSVFESKKECEIKVTALNDIETQMQMRHFFDFESEDDGFYGKTLEFTPKSRKQSYFFPVTSKRIHQICLYQKKWSSANIHLKFEMDFNAKFQKKIYFTTNGYY